MAGSQGPLTESRADPRMSEQVSVFEGVRKLVVMVVCGLRAAGTPHLTWGQEANVLDFQTVAKDIDTLTAVLQLRSSQVVRWKASDQDHPAIRTAGGAAQRP